MKILAIETSTEACSAALLLDDQIISRFELAPREHTRLILPMMEELLAEANCPLNDIDAIAFGRGPGAFTGLRIATGVAQGVALSIDKPVIAVSTLEALAWQIQHQTEVGKKIIAALDARMGEVYWASFEKNAAGLLDRIGDERVGKPAHMLEELKQFDNAETLIATGIGWQAYKDQLLTPESKDKIKLVPDQLPSAAAIAQLALPKLEAGLTVAPEDAQPVYIRDNVALKTKQRENA